MRWKAYVYGSIVFWFILSGSASEMMKRQVDPSVITWWKVIDEFASTPIFMIVGLGMILDYKDLLKWAGEHLNWRPPASVFRLLGWFFFLCSLVILAIGTMDMLIVLGIIPNLYAEDSAVWFLRREVGPLSWALRVRSC